jgi:hypothetical protein
MDTFEGLVTFINSWQQEGMVAYVNPKLSCIEIGGYGRGIMVGCSVAISLCQPTDSIEIGELILALPWNMAFTNSRAGHYPEMAEYKVRCH